MKAEELMLGDWVLAEGRPVQVTNISFLGGDIICVMNPFMSYDTMYASNIVALSKGAQDINKIEPIPLTKEILEKNGFDKFTWWKRGGNHVTTYSFDGFQIQVNEDGTFSLVDNCSEDGDYGYESNWIVDVNYVHKLQHLLKDLEIEKEIIL